MTTKEDLTKVKDQAARALAKGQWDKALEKYEILAKAQPKDLRVKMKLGDILVKLKKTEDAIKLYEEVGESYIRDKFLIQAISVFKLIQQLEPNRPGLNEKLGELNKTRGGPLIPAKPEAAPPDAEPGLPSARPVIVTEVPKSLAAEIAEAKRQKEESREAAAGFKFPETPLFSALGEEEFTQVVGKFQVGRIPKGTTVIKEGTRGDSFFIVAQGDVRVYRTPPKTEKKITLAHLKDGAFFGEMAFFLDSVRTASCETAADTALLRISRGDLEELMARYPNIRAVMQNFFKKRALDQLFKTMNLFASLEEAEREVLMQKFEMMEVEPGTILVQEGEEGKYLFVIFAGEVEVTTQHETKGPVKLASLGPGEFVGEISLVQGKLNTADVIASQKSIIFRMARPIFLELLAIHSPMLEEITNVIEKRLRSTVEALIKTGVEKR